MIIYRSVLLRMRNIPDNSCRENQNRHFMFKNFFTVSRTVYELTWKNTTEPATDDNVIRRMRISCWVTKTTGTHSEYVTPIGFPRQKWLCEGTSILLLYVYSLSC